MCVHDSVCAHVTVCCGCESVCVCACICVCACVCTPVHLCVFECLWCVCTCVCVPVSVGVFVCPCMCVYVRVFMCVSMGACTHVVDVSSDHGQYKTCIPYNTKFWREKILANCKRFVKIFLSKIFLPKCPYIA